MQKANKKGEGKADTRWFSFAGRSIFRLLHFKRLDSPTQAVRGPLCRRTFYRDSKFAKFFVFNYSYQLTPQLELAEIRSLWSQNARNFESYLGPNS